MNERFNQVVKYLVMEKMVRNYAQLGEQMGLKPSTFARMRNGDRNYRVQDVDNLCKIYTNISSDWILFGKGEMLKSSTTQIQHVNDNATGILTNNGSVNVNPDVANLLKIISEQTETIRNLTETIRSLTSK